MQIHAGNVESEISRRRRRVGKRGSLELILLIVLCVRVRGSGLLDKVILEKRELSQFELASLSGRDARTASRKGSERMTRRVLDEFLFSASPTQSFMALSSSRHDLASDAQSVHVSIAQSVTRPRMAQAWSTQADVWVLIGWTK